MPESRGTVAVALCAILALACQGGGPRSRGPAAGETPRLQPGEAEALIRPETLRKLAERVSRAEGSKKRKR